MSDRHDSGCRMKLPLPAGVSGSAVFRGDRDEHRLVLERFWEGEATAPFALWVGMNPSGAEADVDDLTIRKEWTWTGMRGLRRYVKANVGTYRWTDSTSLAATGVPLIHPDNLLLIRALAARADAVILSTGKPPEPLMGPARTLCRALKQDGRKPLCLGVTKEGWPKHSSRLGYATPFVEFAL